MPNESSSLPRSERLAILLAEYNSLRSEMSGRSQIQGQTYVVAATGAIAIIGIAIAANSILAGVIPMVALCIAAFLGIRYLDLDVRMMAARVREIEVAVNEIAGERLMRWESELGVDQIGYLKRLRHIF